ncbi:MAG TPA: LLM class F420-dependent oxidoreductase [Anaerolineales bacterium]
MLDVAIMIEGQDGLNWPRWQRIVKIVEDSGYAGLYRSDHYTNANPPDKDSLELWVSLTWLADNTERIEFGPLVTPVSFRHPTLTARMAAAVDDLSGARLTLGVGAGWQEREHEKFGWELLSVPERFHRYEEGVKVIKMLLESDEPVDFYGKYYRLKEAILLPRPQRSGGPPILIGGNGIKRSLPMAARYADEWNGVYLNPSEFSERNQRLNELLEAEGRDPSKLRRSLMTGCVFGKDEAEVKRKVEARTSGKRTADELRQRGVAVGTANQIADQLGQLAESGVQRVMLQWLELDDLEGIAAMAQGILHQI